MKFSRKAFIDFSCAVTALVATLVIAGWHYNVPILKSVMPGYIAMKVNTAILFAGFAVATWALVHWRRSRWSFAFAATFSFVACAVAVMTLIEHAKGFDFKIGEFFFDDLDGARNGFPPGRMPPIAAFNFILTSAALVLANNPWKRFHKLAQFLDLCVGLIAFQALIGYFCNVTSTFGFELYLQMAIHSTVLFILMTASHTLLHSKTGFVAILRSRSITGSMARRLMLAAAILPPFMTWFQLYCEKAGWLDRNGGMLARTTGIASLLIVIVWRAMTELHESEKKRSDSETTKVRNAHLAQIIATQYEIATAGLDLEKLLNLAVSQAKTLLHADGTIVEMLDGDELRYRATSGNETQQLGLSLKIESSFSGYCMQERRGVKCDDAENDPRVNAEACRKVGVASMIVAPLFKEDKVIGVFKAYSSAKYFFTESDVNTLQLVVGLIAAALARAEAFAEKQKAQEEAQKAAQTKAEFLANMSHEIRTPLNGIIGISDLLAELPLGEQQKKYADIIRSSGQGLLTIVNDILDFSKIEAGKMDLEVMSFNLGTLVQSQIELLAGAAKDKGLVVTTEIDPALKGHYRGDPGRIGQILLNLVGNAIKFTSTGGISIRVAPDREPMSGEQYVRFEIQDTGVGIHEETVQRLFRPFTQADGSTARRYGGTGLGLSISKSLAELMGGKIGVRSEPGNGSTFWFTVRLLAVDKTSTASKPRSAGEELDALDRNLAHRSKFRILIAEDNSVNQMVALAQLKKLGYSAQAVANGKEAVDAFCSGSFHLILMDCQMPEMDGYEATQKIRELEANTGKRIPIIALTANAMKEDEEKCVRSGMDSFIGKPVKREQLLVKLEFYLPETRKKAA